MPLFKIELKPEHDPNLENFHETNFKSIIFYREIYYHYINKVELYDRLIYKVFSMQLNYRPAQKVVHTKLWFTK